MTISKALSDAKSVSEVFSIARQLKADGFDQSDVNAEATKRRKELLTSTASVATLTKRVPMSGDTNQTPISQFAIKVENISSNKVVLMQDGTIVL